MGVKRLIVKRLGAARPVKHQSVILNDEIQQPSSENISPAADDANPTSSSPLVGPNLWPVLSAEAIDVLQKIVANGGRNKPFKCLQTTLYDSDMVSLLVPKMDLTGTIMDAFVGLVNRRLPDDELVVNAQLLSWFYKNSVGVKECDYKKGYDQVKDLGREFGLLQKKRVMFIIHLEETSHWCLGILNKNDADNPNLWTISILDSVKPDNPAAVDVLGNYLKLECIHQLRDGLIPATKKPQLRHRRVHEELRLKTQEMGSNDCGVFVLGWIITLTQGGDPAAVDASSTTYLRHLIADSLINSRTIELDQKNNDN